MRPPGPHNDLRWHLTREGVGKMAMEPHDRSGFELPSLAEGTVHASPSTRAKVRRARFVGGAECLIAGRAALADAKAKTVREVPSHDNACAQLQSLDGKVAA